MVVDGIRGARCIGGPTVRLTDKVGAKVADDLASANSEAIAG